DLDRFCRPSLQAVGFVASSQRERREGIMRLHRLAIILIVEVAFGACVDTDSNTDLVTAGPPEIAQVRLNEAFTDASGAPETRRVFAFGTHPTATADQIGRA